MTEQEVLDLINAFIVANGNNEITANVLNPILEEMVKQPNLLIGVLSQLQTADQTNLVNAINEVYNMFGTISDAGIRLYEGTNNPNTTPPGEYNIADFYIEKDLLNNPVKLWQYNGIIWVSMLTIYDIINDGLTGTNTTWSSDKIVDEISTAVAGAGTVTEVTGTDGVTVATGTTTPIIGLGNITPDSVSAVGTVGGSNLSGTNTGDNSPNTNANGYADSKVQDSISDGTTDKAPSQNAVFDALALKEDIIDYMQQHFFDFSFNTTLATYPMNISAFASGTLAQTSGSIDPALRLTRPSDILECWTIRGNASNANTGYSVGVSGNNPVYVGSVMFFVINVCQLTNVKGRFGLVELQGTNPNDPSLNGIYIEIVDNQLSFSCSLTSTVSTAAPLTLTSASDWLYVMFEVESASSVRCKIRNLLTGAVVYNVTVTSNIPLSVTGSSWRAARISLNCIAPIATSNYLCQLARVMTFSKKPNFLKYF